MKSILSFSPLLLLMISFTINAQIITTDPALPTAGDAVIVYYDATRGTAGLKDYTGDVYAHTGVLTNLSAGGSDWKYVKTDWGVNSDETKLTRVSANLYSLDVGPSIREYYGVPETETITHMAFVFRSSDSELEGKNDGGTDIFVEVFEAGLSISIINPHRNTIVDPDSDVVFEAAASQEANLLLYLNNNQVKSVTGENITHTFSLDTPGDYWIKVTAEAEGEMVADSLFIHVKETQITGPVPIGVIDGINYVDEQTVTLVLHAPLKEDVFVIGDFNNWTPNSDSRMTKDGNRFWITITNLTPDEIYGFQYLVDGELVIADPYTEMTLDPNDKGIDEATYPGLKPYPTGITTGITSVLHTGQEPYAWNHPGFTAPEPHKLVIYELLVRDFIRAHDWKTLSDTLGYLATLGVNAIELMPVNEFEGNESWGYNPSFYFATDKYYGPAVDLKAFIDSCHGRGIAVIIDMVLNHSYSQSPLVQICFENGKVSAGNPWYNVNSPNQTYSWGYDFDHESQDTKDFIDRVNSYWLDSFRVDGFRFDFTKGFTNTPGDGWAYDASRIAILKRMADAIWSVNSDAYVILEHLADNSEERVLSNYGMMLWGNMNYKYNEATMGYHDSNKSDFSGISYKSRGWNDPHLVGYMESHDEERLMFKNLEYGASSGSYNIQELNTALSRMELAGAFFIPIPGPKMIWQFGELGYDYSIDYDCRVCNKPISWDYYKKGVRRRVYQVWSALIGLKLNEPAFGSDDFTLFVSDAVKRIEINHTDMDVRIIGNFDVINQSVDPSFSRGGWWYSFFEGDSTDVTDLHGTISLAPGEYRIYTTKKLYTPDITSGVHETWPEAGDFHVYPNPVSGVLHMEPLPESARLTIFNSSGQVVKTVEMDNNQDQVDLSSLLPGLYIISRRPEKKEPEYVKIIRE
ncbi:MAG: alpha-amylase family glycosyl hydrolase [Bacteroidota bacterium]